MLPGADSLPWVEGVIVLDGRWFRVTVLTTGGRVEGFGRKVVPGPGSYPWWKGLGFGTEGFSSPTRRGIENKEKIFLMVQALSPGGMV